MRLGWRLPTDLTRSRLLHHPTVGMFWQADHVVPVAEGGGQCDLTNLRTLCTQCHARETKELAARLVHQRRAKQAVGTKDIRSFFAKKSKK